jgi:hypothetical protein
MQFFEATAQQKKLADIGRAMMDFSEQYGVKNGLKGVTDDGMRTLNNLSHVGNLLTHYGAPFGTSQKNFSDADMKLIADFMGGKLAAQKQQILEVSG